ncbi:DUF1120 domain-containing protein [Bordetella sp. 02P26C-1]|uniref:DUF1120 domain-containing protein n=1 Tax=Bordetella sp. 02P26C-1 TaxID=2683195 RepID=UPI001355D4D0|nr:DUF1120 domain-containing protein [Bordetella sp. 02P26C-1]MVW79078.1 DUF1120 domain-containing protein [Bordetella sp. 02P26C-1]
MKRTLLSLALAATALSPMLATAASSVQMKVAGTIYPAACDISMPGGTTIDYGRIASATLNKDTVTKIGDDVRAKVAVTCNAPTLFAIKSSDARAATKIAVAGSSPATLFGLGKSGSVNIGAYSINLVDPIDDAGKRPRVLSTPVGSTVATATALVTPGELVSFGEESGVKYAAHKSVTADMKFTTYIEKASALPLKGDIKLDGLATFELVYM